MVDHHYPLQLSRRDGANLGAQARPELVPLVSKGFFGKTNDSSGAAATQWCHRQCSSAENVCMEKERAEEPKCRSKAYHKFCKISQECNECSYGQFFEFELCTSNLYTETQF